MYLKNKKVLVFGLGISGLSTVKALDKLEANIIVVDSKTEKELERFFEETKEIFMEKYLNTDDIPLKDVDLIVKSPGISPNVPILLKAKEKNIEIITDIELAYRISPTPNIIAITGTNGKTTTTSLVGEIFKSTNYNTFIGGNIGIGILWDMVNAKKEDVFIIETSSFQLENTINFKPKVSLITNITPDHLDWHGDYKNYINAKKNIFKNQDELDYIVLNYDDEILRAIEDVHSNIIWFSRREKLDKGIYIDDEYIVINEGNKINKVMPYKDLKILGKHNLENVLGAIGISYVMGIDLDIVVKILREFSGVEHRIEYVDTIKGKAFYNDSKGTNIDSTIKAIDAVDNPIILIAGGYDKGGEFDDLILSFNGKVEELILLGATKEKIKETAMKHGFKNLHLVENMREAVELSYKMKIEKCNVLLSPACASWGMYNNFEERGQDFKDAVYGLRED